jgi:hypothetical protein
MVLIYLKSGECIELADAATAEHDNGDLICLDPQGRKIASFERAQVEAFTVEPLVAEVIKDEICEELTVVGNEPDSEGLALSDA